MDQRDKSHEESIDTLVPESIIVAQPEQVSCKIQDEVVILNFKSGTYYSLNSVGARIWELIQERRIVNEVLEVVMEEYVVERERCEQDLLRLFRRLIAANLVYQK